MAKDFRSNVEINGTLNVSGDTTASAGTSTFSTVTNIGGTSNQRITLMSGAGSHGIEIGRTDSVASTPYIDFHSSSVTTDYDVRLIVNNTSSVAGQGQLTVWGTLWMQNKGIGSTAAANTFASVTISSGNLTVSTGSTSLGPTTLTDTEGINFASTATDEGGQINLLPGSSHSNKKMQIDNYQGDLRVIGNNGGTEYFRIGQTGGITIAAGTASVSPLKLTSGTLNTSPVAGVIEYDGNAFYGTTNTSASSRGVIPVNIFATNTSSLALSAVNTAQSIFATADDVVAVAGSTTYKFSLFFALSAAGTSSVAYSENFLFGGTASSTASFGYRIITQRNATAITQPGQGANIFWSQSASANLFAATATTAQYIIASIEGIIRTGASGTLTPQIQFTVTPQNTISASILANSYIELTPIGSSAVAGMTPWT